jgi:hypothetical protein
VTFGRKRVATLLAKLIVILCDFSPFPSLQSKVHVFLQPFLTCILNIDIHQRSVIALKVNEDARVKKKACNTDIEEEITGFEYASVRVELPMPDGARMFEAYCVVLFSGWLTYIKIYSLSLSLFFWGGGGGGYWALLLQTSVCWLLF